LLQGRKEKETIYSNHPAEMALKWQEQGAEFLHIVDLDGAFEGYPQNTDVISDILKSISIPVQVGGGIRSAEAIEELLKLGVERVIMGTVAMENPDLVTNVMSNFGGDKVVIGIDAIKGDVKVSGWVEGSEMNFVDLADEMKDRGVERIIYTDIEKDGMLTGPTLKLTKQLAEETGLKGIAAGGIASIEDVKKVKALEKSGIEGVIIGKALYENKFNLKQLFEELAV